MLPLPCEIITTNPGNCWFSLPMPYDNHEPKAGRPACWCPVWMNVTAGSWLIASVHIDFTTHQSSAIRPMLGSSSLTHSPLLPCCRHSNIGATQGNLLCPDVIPVSLCPIRIDAGNSSP